MEKQEFVYSKFDSLAVEMNTQKERNMFVLRGKALLNETEARFIFIQNPKEGKRSVEVARGPHCRMVRRHDGLYTLTFRFDGEEKYIREALIAEVRQMATAAKNDITNLKSKHNERQATQQD